MPRKRQARAQSVEDARTPEEIAKERITEWKRDPKKFHPVSRNFGAVTRPLYLTGLGLKKVPETLREVHDLELLFLTNNYLQELPQWIGELSALKAIGLVNNYFRTLPLEIGSLRGLRYLYLDENRLGTLPEALRTLPLKELT